MDLQKIRNMNDAELERYLQNLAKRDCHKCSICGEESFKIVKIENKDYLQTKQLCGICDECYEKLLEFLHTTDINWS
jgi:hypothetical protein